MGHWPDFHRVRREHAARRAAAYAAPHPAGLAADAPEAAQEPPAAIPETPEGAGDSDGADAAVPAAEGTQDGAADTPATPPQRVTARGTKARTATGAAAEAKPSP